MNENMGSVIDILRDALRQIEENYDPPGNEAAVNKLKNEFRLTIRQLELLRERDLQTNNPEAIRAP